MIEHNNFSWQRIFHVRLDNNKGNKHTRTHAMVRVYGAVGGMDLLFLF